MRWKIIPLGLAALSLGLAGCGGDAGNDTGSAANEASDDAAADQTIAAGLDQQSRFFQAARATGIDATLAGSEPYTVFVPSDEAFARVSEQMDQLSRPESRGQLTQVLTYHILPGTVLVEDIRKTIENANDQAVLMTMAGETFSAALDGDRIVLTDAAGATATITEGDQRRSNGVVHHIDAVLMPGEPGADEEQQAAPQPQ